MKQGVWLALVLCVLAGAGPVACGGKAKNAGAGLNAGNDAGGGSDGAGPPPESAGTADSAPAAPRPGWSIRDTTPYSRIEHAAVLDEARDRMLVIGGTVGLDVWALPLSGQGKNQWTQILPEGDSPPADESNVGLPVSAVYDPFGQRLLVLRADSYESSSARVWELTLDDSPAWHELQLKGPEPGAELDQGKMIVDRDGKRVLIVGGGQKGVGTWALSLEGAPRWSRLADAPSTNQALLGPFAFGVNDGVLLVDSARERLVLITDGLIGDSQVWALPLAGGGWTLEGSNACGPYYDTTSVYDSARERVLFIGHHCGLSSYSLASGEWQVLGQGEAYTSPFGPISSVDDVQRGRALFFSGGSSEGNATSALGYDDLNLSVLVPNTLGITPGGTAAVWDQQRQALVAFGAFDENDGVSRTKLHGASASDRWLDAASPLPAFSAGVYDANEQAVISIGHPYLGATTENVARLSSVPGSDWEIIPAAGGPGVRSWPVAIYDSAGQRLVVHGGESARGNPPDQYFDDTWALSLDGDPQWTELVTSGDSGGARSRQTAIFDPVARRLISYGGSPDAIASYGPGDLHQLTLDDSLHWSKLRAAGTGPARAEGVLTVYDPVGERMLALDRTHLFALTLRGDPTWHRFCEPGIGMPGSSAPILVSDGPTQTLLGLASDGLFVALGDGTFRFDLATAYCD
ncbi:MAG: hypothetical protein ABW061_21095 [Polyangiaceae bacterium]